MEPVQLSFLETLAPEPPKAHTVWEKLAEGLKANRMGRIDREEYLADQVERMKDKRSE